MNMNYLKKNLYIRFSISFFLAVGLTSFFTGRNLFKDSLITYFWCSVIFALIHIIIYVINIRRKS